MYNWLESNGRIGPALQDLKEWEYIEVEKDNQVKITESGLRILEDTRFWV